MHEGEYHSSSDFDEITKNQKPIDGLDKKILNAFKNYSYSLNKHLLNKARINPKDDGSEPMTSNFDGGVHSPEHPDYFLFHTEKKIKILDDLIDKNKLSKNLKTYTGIRFTPDKKMFLPGFTSSSIHRHIAENFAEDNPSEEIHILEIHHKKGQSAYFIEDHSDYHEREVLIPRNQKIHIHETEEIKPNVFLHKAERIDGGERKENLKEDLNDFPDSVTHGSFYHGGANVDKLHPLSFFSPKKENAESYARIYGNGSKVHEVQMQNLNKAARDQDVINAAKELGHYEDEYTPANHYLSNSTVEDDVVHAMIDHLKSKGFDHARLHDNDYDYREFTSVLPFHPETQIVR